MRTRHKHILSLLRRVNTFVGTVKAPGDPLATAARELAESITRLEDFGARQEEHNRRMLALTTRARARARTLRSDHLRSVSLAARAALPHESTDAVALEQSVRLPRYGVDYEQVVLAARGVASVAEAHQERLRAAGLPAQFLESLEAAASELVALIGERAEEFQRRVAATKGVESSADRGLAMVRLLDSLVRPLIRDDAVRLVEWERVIRRTRSSGGATTTADAGTPAPAPGGESAQAA